MIGNGFVLMLVSLQIFLEINKTYVSKQDNDCCQHVPTFCQAEPSESLPTRPCQGSRSSITFFPSSQFMSLNPRNVSKLFASSTLIAPCSIALARSLVQPCKIASSDGHKAPNLANIPKEPEKRLINNRFD